MKSSLREQFGRLGPVRDLDRVQSGSPGVLALRPTGGSERVETVSAALVLARRGISLAKAKRVLEEMLSTGRTVVRVPVLDSVAALSAELDGAGVAATEMGGPDVEPKAIREGLGLTQEQFALRFGLDLDSVQNWEARRRRPDAATRSYLRVIQRLPDHASEALEVSATAAPRRP